MLVNIFEVQSVFLGLEASLACRPSPVSGALPGDGAESLRPPGPCSCWTRPGVVAAALCSVTPGCVVNKARWFFGT